MIDFFIACTPSRVSHHHKKIVTIKTRDGRQFTKLADRPELRQAVASWIDLLMPHVPPAPVPPPVYLHLELTWPWRASDSKRDRARGRIPCTVKPDWDNTAKTITDVLAMLRFVDNDSQIADGRVEKWIGDIPGLRVRMGTMESWLAHEPPPLFQETSR